MALDKKEQKAKIFERVYSDDVCDQIWKYNLDKQPNGPISVETKWKANILKDWKDGKKLKSKRIKTKK